MATEEAFSVVDNIFSRTDLPLLLLVVANVLKRMTFVFVLSNIWTLPDMAMPLRCVPSSVARNLCILGEKLAEIFGAVVFSLDAVAAYSIRLQSQ
jgi:hypothetical protein